MKTKTKNNILGLLTSMAASLVPALIFGKWLEAVIFVICHTLIRGQFAEQYHHIIPAMCRVITASVFFFGVCFILPLELSLISAIPINYLISWVGAVKREKDVLQAKTERQRAKIAELLEKENLPINKLIAKCRSLKINERNTKVAIMYYIENKTPKEIWKWLCENNQNMELESVYMLLNRLNKRLK